MNDSPYTGRRIALLTKHAKQRVIGPTLKQSLGSQIRTITTFDTDTLGTFTREIPRAGSQLEAARKKARIGMELSGLSLGLGSEGSFGPDPFVGMFPWNIEYLVFIDDERGIEVIGIAQGAPMDRQLSTDTWTAAKKFAIESGFPKHHLVVRPDSANDLRIHKTLSTWKLLETAFHAAKAQSSQGQVFLENDLRAHANPTRMANIKRAAEDLATKLACACPQCKTPGFSIVERVKGLPCAQCSSPTEEVQAEVYRCQKCSFTQEEKRANALTADPGRCRHCNP
jgi:hypothetical protein